MGVVAVIGATTWGSTLAWLLARNGHGVRIVTRSREEARSINLQHASPRVPALSLPGHTAGTTSAAVALHGADAVVMAAPAASVRDNARSLRRALAAGTTVVSATKGLEPDTGRRVSEMLLDELPQLDASDICVLSGPNLAGEIARGLPAATVIAGVDDGRVTSIQRLLHTRTFRVYASADPVGVELAGALKNVIAIAAGIADGLGFGDNAKAGIITRGLAEITRLGVAAGADPATFSGLAGVGDVMATCYSPLSRNRTFGEAIARGSSVEAAIEAAAGVVEGIGATKAACTLARRFEVEMPIAEGLGQILFEGAAPSSAIARLLEREPRRER